ncbi:MAG: 6-bladed beta-propeller [Draconibacterium sp.]
MNLYFSNSIQNKTFAGYMRWAILGMWILVGSCANNKGKDGRFKAPDNILSIVYNEDKAIELSINESSTEYQLLFLEHNEDSYIGNVDKIIFSEGNIFVLDKAQRMIFIFDRNGNYMAKIDDTGRGGNEYIQINDFCLSKTSNTILASVVCGGHSSVVFEYGINGNMVNRFNLPFSSYKIEKSNNRLFFYSDYTTTKEHGHNIHITSAKGKVISKSFPYKKRQGGWGIESDVFKVDEKGDIYYFPVFCDTIYRLKEDNSFEPVIVLKATGETHADELCELYQNISPERFMETEHKFFYQRLSNVRLFQDLIYFEADKNNIGENFIFDIQSDKLYKCISNDYFSTTVVSPLSTDKTWLVGIVNPFEVHDFVNQVIDKNVDYENFMEDNVFIKEIFEKTNFDSNPVIVKYKLKEKDWDAPQ